MTSGNNEPMRCSRRKLSLMTLLLSLSQLRKSRAVAEVSPPPIGELMQHLAQVAESHSTFTEVKTIDALTVPLRASGDLYYRRPNYFEKATTQPRPEKLVVDGDRLTMSINGEPPRVVDLDGQAMIRGLVDAIRGTLAGNLALLQQFYQVEMDGDLAGWRLTLTPTDPSVQRAVTRIIISGKQTTLQFIHTIQVNGDESRMTISRTS
jgi:outer membrane lipoprotein-sorting protein